MSTETVYLLLPEIILILFATAIYVGGTLVDSRDGWGWLSAAGILLAGMALLQQQDTSAVHRAVFDEAASGLWSGPLLIDYFSMAGRWLVLGVALMLVMVVSRSIAPGLAPEFFGSLILIAAGLMLVILSGDLVLTFVGLELVSIPTYVVLALGRGGPSFDESTTKYFFLSILSSALLLYGFSFLYGLGGSTQLDHIHQALEKATVAAPHLAQLGKVAMVLVFAGLGFRITVVPFHFYAPDVYEGTSHPNAGLLAVVPKIAGLAALVRIVCVSMVGSHHYLKELAGVGWHLALALSLVTMTLGNLAALWQQNIRRMLAYSSVAHAGYMLIGLSVGFATTGGAAGVVQVDGIGATLFYLLVYALATLGAFATLAYLGDGDRQIETVDDLAGLGRSHTWAAAGMAVFMFSLTGLPPFAGFWGKFALLTGALGIKTTSGTLSPWFVGLSIAAVLNAAISAGYYLRVVAVMYFRPALGRRDALGGAGAGLAALICAALVIGVGANPGSLMEKSDDASRAAQRTIDRQLPPLGQAAEPKVSVVLPEPPASTAQPVALAE